MKNHVLCRIGIHQWVYPVFDPKAGKILRWCIRGEYHCQEMKDEKWIDYFGPFTG